MFRLAYGQIRSVDPEIMKNARQLGVDNVHFNLPFDLKAEKKWRYEDLKDFMERCGQYGVHVEGMENLPISFYDKAMLGEEGREEQIDNVCESIRNLGRAGIPVLGYHFSPSFVWRTANFAPVGRYGSTVQAFDLALQEQGIDDMADFGQRRDVKIPDVEFLWENFDYFMKRVIPVCEEYGVTMALHPDDPPIASLSGIARMFIDLDSYRRAEKLINSKNWGLLFCIGSFSQMAGGAKNVFEAIEEFGPRGKLIYAHFRDVQGTVPKFQECFLGEGNFDPFQVIRALMKSGFDGFLLSDHVPGVAGDTPWGHRVRYADTAYVKGLMEAISKMERAADGLGA
ncbi:MAG: mannonate dehydratase [Candidatus Limiplasma sp.]|nr:mannonate dehydratase [Candidatus Limiplasma sp.]